jgi:hypothetical protein
VPVPVVSTLDQLKEEIKVSFINNYSESFVNIISNKFGFTAVNDCDSDAREFNSKVDGLSQDEINTLSVEMMIQIRTNPVPCKQCPVHIKELKHVSKDLEDLKHTHSACLRHE